MGIISFSLFLDLLELSSILAHTLRVLEISRSGSQKFLALSDEVIVLRAFQTGGCICVHCTLILSAILDILMRLILPILYQCRTFFISVSVFMLVVKFKLLSAPR